MQRQSLDIETIMLNLFGFSCVKKINIVADVKVLHFLRQNANVTKNDTAKHKF